MYNPRAEGSFSMRHQLFATKSLSLLLEEMAGENRLRRVLGPVQLTSLGVGAIIGAGIFVATGAAARNVAGPALMLSYVVAGVTCIFAALCYAEFASMVFLKVSVVLFVILVGAFYINPENWKPFAPYGMTGVSFFGHTLFGQVNAGGEPVGMFAGAAIIFFAYIGFDSVSTHAEEARQPKRDVPIGIIASLLICTVLYIGVVAVLTGMVRYDEIDVNAGVADAFDKRGLSGAQFIISAAGVA